MERIKLKGTQGAASCLSINFKTWEDCVNELYRQWLDVSNGHDLQQWSDDMG